MSGGRERRGSISGGNLFYFHIYEFLAAVATTTTTL